MFPHFNPPSPCLVLVPFPPSATSLIPVPCLFLLLVPVSFQSSQTFLMLLSTVPFSPRDLFPSHPDELLKARHPSPCLCVRLVLTNLSQYLSSQSLYCPRSLPTSPNLVLPFHSCRMYFFESWPRTLSVLPNFLNTYPPQSLSFFSLLLNPLPSSQTYVKPFPVPRLFVCILLPFRPHQNS